MDHAAFLVRSELDVISGVTVRARFGVAGGDLTGVRPDIAATWRGVMVGTSGRGGGDMLQGDAALTWTLDGAGGSLDAAFTDIVNLGGSAHSTPALRFDDIPVTADGVWADGQAGNRIQGGFYGPGHAEAAGIVEQSGIIGAFGAKRQ